MQKEGQLIVNGVDVGVCRFEWNFSDSPFATSAPMSVGSDRSMRVIFEAPCKTTKIGEKFISRLRVRFLYQRDKKHQIKMRKKHR